VISSSVLCSFGATVPTEIYTPSLHDALPISPETRIRAVECLARCAGELGMVGGQILDMESEERACTEQEILDIQSRKTGALIQRSEEHTSELQSRFDLVCRLLLAKKTVATEE